MAIQKALSQQELGKYKRKVWLMTDVDLLVEFQKHLADKWIDKACNHLQLEVVKRELLYRMSARTGRGEAV